MRTVVTFALFCLLARGEGKPPAKPAPKVTAEQRAAQAMLRSLNLRDRVGQLVMGAYYGDAPSARSKELIKFRHWVKDLHIGGFIMVNRVQYGLVRTAEPHAMALFFNQMQKLSKTPLLIGADFERGSSMRVSDTIRFPFNMAFAAARDVEASRHQGLATAREARALGCAVGLRAGRRRQQQSAESGHQHSLLRRESGGSRAARRRLHRRRALRSQEPGAGFRQTFSGSRRHQHRQPSGSGAPRRQPRPHE